MPISQLRRLEVPKEQGNQYATAPNDALPRSRRSCQKDTIQRAENAPDLEPNRPADEKRAPKSNQGILATAIYAFNALFEAVCNRLSAVIDFIASAIYGANQSSLGNTEELDSKPFEEYIKFSPEDLKELGFDDDIIEESRKMATRSAAFEMMGENFDSSLKERDLERVDIIGDGNCFYRAISVALSNDFSVDGQSKHSDYRKLAVKSMDAQLNAFKDNLAKANAEERIALEDQIASFGQRKEIAIKDKEFAESQEIEALSHALGISFVILSWHGDESGPFPIAEGESRIKEHIVNADLYSERPPIVLLHELNHYNLAIPKNR